MMLVGDAMVDDGRLATVTRPSLNIFLIDGQTHIVLCLRLMNGQTMVSTAL